MLIHLAFSNIEEQSIWIYQGPLALNLFTECDHYRYLFLNYVMQLNLNDQDKLITEEVNGEAIYSKTYFIIINHREILRIISNLS